LNLELSNNFFTKNIPKTPTIELRETPNEQRNDITKEDVSSVMVTTEPVMLTCVIDAQKDRDIVVVDIPNAFVQTVVNKEDAEHYVIVHIRGPLVEVWCKPGWPKNLENCYILQVFLVSDFDKYLTA
jgi:hypothetical protein